MDIKELIIEKCKSCNNFKYKVDKFIACQQKGYTLMIRINDDNLSLSDCPGSIIK